MSISELKIIQQQIRKIITDPHGVEHALAKEKKFTTIDSDRLSATERISVYAEAYFARILDALAEDFRIVKKILGAEAFQQLIADYLISHPSQTTNLAEIGIHLPAFVSQHVYGKEVPYLTDVSNLEWTAIESFYTDEPAPFDFSVLQLWNQEDLDRARFITHPSLKLLPLSFDLGELWKARDAGQATFDEVEQNIKPSENSVMAIFSIAGVVKVSLLSHDEAAALAALMSTGRLSELADFSPDHVSRWFESWTSSGILSSIQKLETTCYT